MNTLPHETLAKKSVTLDIVKLRKVRRLLKAKNDSDTLRRLVDKELMLQLAYKAAQDLRKSGGLGAVIWR